MKKIKIIGIIVMLIISSITILSSLNVYAANNFKANTLYVGGSGPSNFSTIQEAIDTAVDGDTVFVYDDLSPYYENIILNKSINLVGENKITTVIDGNSGVGIIVTVNDTSISNFKIANCFPNTGLILGDSFSMSFFVPGLVYNNSVNNVVFENNKINLFIVGDDHLIQNISSENVDIYDIFLLNANNNILINNDLEYPGINIYYVGTTTDFSAYFDYFYHEIDTSNTINGNPVYYYKDTNNVIVPTDAGEVLAVNCSDITIDKMINPLFIETALVNNSVISNNTCNICLASSNNNEIIKNSITETNVYHYPFEGLFSGFALGSTSDNNTVRQNTFTCSNVSMIINGSYNDISWNNFLGDEGLIGIIGQSSSNNYISNNTFSTKSKYGITLSISKNDKICDNIITSNNECGIVLESAFNDTITGNNITDNGQGIHLNFSDGNLIYNNYFDNVVNAYDEGNNFWNITKTIGTNIIGESYFGGNYWHDYSGYDTDKPDDGLGDTDLPYNSDGNIKNGGDMSPLVYIVPPVENIDTGETFDTIQEAIDAKNTTNGHTITVKPGTYYENLVINKSINLIGKDNDTTIIDGGEIGTVIEINSDGVLLSNFTIQNGSIDWPYRAYGIYIDSDNNSIENNIVRSNEFGIRIYRSSNNTIKNNIITYSKDGIIIVGDGNSEIFASNNKIVSNIISNNSIGISTIYVSNCNISDNKITDNRFRGFDIISSFNNDFIDNVIIMADVPFQATFGMYIATSSDNKIFRNTIKDGTYGIDMGGSTPSNNNTIYHNTFMNNDDNAWDNYTNNWENGLPNGGNYWDDYDGIDSDGNGIGDTPYDIPGGDNQDRYPLGFFNEPPTADAGGPYTGEVGEVITFDGSGSSDPDGSIVSYEWDFDNDGEYDDGTGVSPAYSWSNPGSYTIRLKVTDDHGHNDSDTATVVISEENTPPIADAGGPYTGEVGEVITFNGSGSSDSDGIIVSYEWDFDNDGEYDDGTGVSPAYSWSNPGSYTIRLKVTDDHDHNDSDTATVVISEENTPPIADAGGPYYEFIGNPITFDGSRSYDIGTLQQIQLFEWDFGDGTTGKGVLTIHTYLQEGNYTITLTVTDDGGKNDTDTTYALISKPNLPPSKPSVNGPINGRKNIDYNFSFMSIDPDNDDIRYAFNWSDGSNLIFTDFFQSGIQHSVMHNWTDAGIYIIKIHAEDTNNAVSETAELEIFIDIDFLVISELDGYLLDYEMDGIYDKFYKNSTMQTDVELLENGKYKIDSNGDGNWDYIYDSLNGALVAFEIDEGQEDNYLIIIIPISIILISVIIIISIFVYLRKKSIREGKKEKLQIEEDIEASKKIKGICPICGKEFYSLLNEEQGFYFATCNHCGKKLKGKKK